MLQLNPPIPIMTPRGAAIAHFVVDYGIESDLYWTVFLDSNGECWTFSNREIRACKNITLGRLNVPLPAAQSPIQATPSSTQSESSAALKPNGVHHEGTPRSS
jgi:hypothetical protein